MMQLNATSRELMIQVQSVVDNTSVVLPFFRYFHGRDYYLLEGEPFTNTETLEGFDENSVIRIEVSIEHPVASLYPI